MDVTLFQTLSADLTGEPHLHPNRAAGLLQRFLTVADPQVVARLAEVAAALPSEPAEREEAIRSRIIEDTPLRELAKVILVLWYTGDLLGSTTSTPTEDEYFGGLLWPVARAHPPGLSGGYFGHWTYPPDN
jgi:hypothetical protein